MGGRLREETVPRHFRGSFGDDLSQIGEVLVGDLNDPDQVYDAYRSVVNELLNSDWPPKGRTGEHLLLKLQRVIGEVRCHFDRSSGRLALSFSGEEQWFYFYLAQILAASPRRLRRCLICLAFFYDRTRNASKRYCNPRCASRATSRDYRAAGKERTRRRLRRVTSK